MKVWIKKWIVLGLSLVFLFSVLEVSLRVYLAYRSPLPSGLAKTTTEQYIRLTPNYSGEKGGIIYETNSFGFRDDEFAIPKLEKTIRVVFFGDSTTIGMGMNHSLTFPEIIEKRLNEGDIDWRFESVNTAFPGHTTSSELDLLRKDFTLLDPDIVILGLPPADLHDNFIYDEYQQRYHKPQANYTLIDYLRKIFFFRQYSKMYTYVRLKLSFNNKIRKEIEEKKPLLTLGDDSNNPYLDPDSRYWRRERELLHEMNTFLKQRNVPLVIVYIPHKQYLIPQHRFEGILRNLSEELDVGYIDVGTAILAYKDNNPQIELADFFQPDDMSHPSALSTPIIADVVVEALRDHILYQVS